MSRLLVFFLTLASVVLAAYPAIAAPQGVAVLAANGARDDAFSLARAVYVTRLRPRKLDEVRARILGGDPAPEVATKDVKDLAELRAAVTGEDAASRQILGGIAKQLDVQAILVVTKRPGPTPDPADVAAADAGASAGGPEPRNDALAGTRAEARLFLAEQGDFDAARYMADGTWAATVASVAARFPEAAPALAPPGPLVAVPPLTRLPPEKKEESRPFYKSPWLWGAVAAALVVGGVFFFASQDKSDDPIHLRMNVPR